MGTASLVEQALFFGIGFLVASLAAVLVIPAILRRATRLFEVRSRLNAPLNEKLAAAEHDAIRARHAVEQVRLQHKLTLANEASARLKVDLGRQAVKIITLEATASEREILLVDLRDQVAKGESERCSLETALGASQIALHDLFAQRDRANVAEAAAIARQTELEAQANRDKARIAILMARRENMEVRFEDLSRSAKAGAENAEKAHAQLNELLAKQLAETRRLDGRLREATFQNEQLRESLSRSEVSLEVSRRRLVELESRLALSAQVREETLLENGRQLAVLADRETALRIAREQTAELEARLAAVSADARAGENAAALRAQTVDTAHAAMEGSLQAARADREALQRQNEELRARIAALSNGEDDAALRESIERLGREVSRLFADQEAIDQREDRAAKGRSSFGHHSAVSLVDPPSNERHGFAEGPGRRVARSHAPDR